MIGMNTKLFLTFLQVYKDFKGNHIRMTRVSDSTKSGTSWWVIKLITKPSHLHHPDCWLWHKKLTSFQWRIFTPRVSLTQLLCMYMMTDKQAGRARKKTVCPVVKSCSCSWGSRVGPLSAQLSVKLLSPPYHRMIWYYVALVVWLTPSLFFSCFYHHVSLSISCMRLEQ